MPQEETKVATETVSESPAEETQQPSSNDEYIAESKKYRKRAQDAEARLSELENMLKKQEETKLKENEEWKSLYEKATSENESLLEKAKKHDAYESSRRALLLEKHPVEDQEQLKNLPLDTLEFVTEKINNNKANAPEVAGNTRKNTKPIGNWAEMDAQERRDNWGEIVKSFNKNS